MPARGPLDVDTVISFLVDRELVRRDELFDLSVRAAAVTRRNRNIRVHLTATRGFFVKQAEPTTEFGVESLRREIAFFSDERHRVTRQLAHAPGVVWYESQRPLLILALLTDHHSLSDHFRSFNPPRFPVSVFHQLGRILAELHARASGLRAPHDLPSLGEHTAPWAFSAHLPPVGALLNLSPGAAHALAIIQTSDSLREGLGAARDAWRDDAFIHGDLRSDNVLVRVIDDQTTDVRLVDWELARLGDPAWDLAALIHGVLLYWVSGLEPRISDADVARMVDSARVPWSVLQPAVQALCHSYFDAAADHVAPVDAPRVRSEKLATFTAVRVVQSVLEMSERLAYLPAHGVLLLQLAENLLLDPSGAAHDVLGLR